MAKRKKGAVRKGRGAMCNICARNCGKGGSLAKHVKSLHSVDYAQYKDAFYGSQKTIIADTWDDSVKTTNGDTVITHVLVRRFVVSDPGPRGVRTTPKTPHPKPRPKKSMSPAQPVDTSQSRPKRKVRVKVRRRSSSSTKASK